MRPIDQFLNENVEWECLPPSEDVPNMVGLPYATHSGVLNLFGCSLRCYRLSDGNAIFDADDFNALIEKMGFYPNHDAPHSP